MKAKLKFAHNLPVTCQMRNMRPVSLVLVSEVEYLREKRVDTNAVADMVVVFACPVSAIVVNLRSCYQSASHVEMAIYIFIP